MKNLFLQHNKLGIATMLAILFLCLMPATPVMEDLGFFELDKLVHIIMYAFLTYINTRGLARYLGASNGPYKYATHFAVLISLVFGAVIEALQELLPTGRQYEAYDLLANAIGTFLAWLLIKGIKPRKQ